MLAYLDCFSGISGDMLLGALVDAGADIAVLRAGLLTLPLTGYTLEAERVSDHGISGTRVHVRLDAPEEHDHRHLPEIERIIAASELSERARARAVAIFRRLAEAEGKIHGEPPEQVAFHEVGAVDSIVDIVGTALGLELLGVDDLACSPLPLTSGRVRSAHGDLPVPAPATLELLAGTGATWAPVAAEGELVTPTGAAVLATLAEFARPQMTVRAVGYGFGTRQLPWANCLRLILGDAANTTDATDTTDPAAADGFERDTITVLECHIDNMTGEALGWLLERLLAVGALDAAYTPLQMKKNRPAVLLTVLAPPNDADRLAALIVRESGTLGVRMHQADRLKAARRSEAIETPWGSVRVKLKLIGGEIIGVAPEYDDCRAIAAAQALPLEDVTARITALARQRYGLG